MGVVFFSDGVDKPECRRLQAVLKPLLPKRSLEIFTKFEDFSHRVRRFPRGIDVAVLSAQNDYQLTALLSLSDYLDSVRIILILPEWDRGMMSRGHLLRPRFVAVKNSDYADIAAVLSKMLRNGHPYFP